MIFILVRLITQTTSNYLLTDLVSLCIPLMQVENQVLFRTQPFLAKTL